MNTLNGYSKSTLTDLYALTAAGGHFPIHLGRNNEANKLVRTDANGYLNTGWINTTSGAFTETPSRIYASNDAYIRYMTPANFFPTLTNDDNQLSITVGGQNRKLTVEYATNSDTVDDYHAESFLLRLRRRNLNISSTDCGMVPPNILGFRHGYPLYTDPEFASGTNNVKIYNNSGGTAVTITRENSTTSGNSSGYCLHIKSAASGASPNGGGFYLGSTGTRGKVYVCVFRASVPLGYNVVFATNSIGSGGNHGWLTDTAGTGKYEWYAYMVEWGTSDTSSSFFFYLNKTATVDWYLSYINVIDITKGNYDGLRTRYSDYATQSDKVANSLTFSAGVFSAKTYNGSSAVTVNIPTHTSHLTNNSGFLTSRGYIGTTAVQESSAAQALTGITNATMSGLTSTNTLKINSTVADSHIVFSRASYNYITAPAGGSIAFCVNGNGIGGVTSELVISDGSVFSGTTTVTSLGRSSERWSNVYSVLGNYSGLITATAGVQIGSTADIGWYSLNSRICAGISVARGVNIGDLLVSNAWADYTKVPTNGIYSKGGVTSSSTVTLYSASGDSPHLVFQRGTTSDGTYDWDQYVTNGYFKLRYNVSGTWTDILSLYPGAYLLAGNTILTSGNSSVSGGGSSWGSSITVKINETSKTLTLPTTIAWSNITDKPSSYTPSSHTHYYITTSGDNRSVATTPNSYSNKLIFQGLKNKATIDSPSSDTYSYLVGLRGWSDSSGGNSWELAFNNTGIFARTGATTSWGSWQRLAYFSEITKTNVGLGNVQNTAFYKRLTTVNGETWNMAGTNSNAAFTIYAPTIAGTSGQVLTSTGGIPSWVNQSSITAGNADTIDNLHSYAFKKTWQTFAGKTYIGWVTIAKWTISTASHFSSRPFMLSIFRSYNSPASESYTFSISFGWDTAHITQVSGNAKNRIIEKLRIAKCSDNLTYRLEMYVNTSYTTYDNTCTCVAYGYYDNNFSATPVCELTANVESTLAEVTTASNYIVGNLSGNATSASKLSTVSKTAWGQTYWTSEGIPTSISGNMTGVGTISAGGSITSSSTTTTYLKHTVSNSNGSVSIYAATNRGLYDDTNSAWILYLTASASNVYIPKWASKGSTTQPVYFNSSGEPTVGTSYAKAIKAITRNGITFTYTCIDGTTGTFTQQDTTYNFSGVSFTSGNSSTGTHDCNSITSNGVWYYNANGPTTTLGASATDGALYSQAYSTSWVGQIAQDYRDGDLFTRGRNNGTWTTWKKVAYISDIPTKVSDLTDDVVAGKYLPLTGGVIKNGAIRNPLTIDTTNEVGSYINFATNGVAKAYVGYNSSVGVFMEQNSIALKLKDGIATLGNYIILHSNNYSSYALPLTGGALTGPLVFNGSDTDRNVIRINCETGDANKIGNWGYTLKYLGSGTGINNALALYADNSTATTQNLATKWLNDGTMYSRSIIPHSTKTYDLGSSSANFNNIYAGHVYIGGTAANTTSKITSDTTTNMYFDVGGVIALLVLNSSDKTIRSGTSHANTVNLGASNIPFKNIYGTTIYENGTSLASKYQAKGNYAGSSSNGGSATSANKLNKITGAIPSVCATPGLGLTYYTLAGTTADENNKRYAGDNTGFPVSSNANSILWLGNHAHSSDSTQAGYGGQMGISSNGNLYYRFITNGAFPTTADGGSWKQLAFTTLATTSVSGLMSASDKTKLNGISAGAEVNVQSDWSITDTSSDAYIKNKPTIPEISVHKGTAEITGVNVSITPNVICSTLSTPTVGTRLQIKLSRNYTTETDLHVVNIITFKLNNNNNIVYTITKNGKNVPVNNVNTDGVLDLLFIDDTHAELIYKSNTSYNYVFYGECRGSSTAIAKSVSFIEPGFSLMHGTKIVVDFINGNTANAPTLNVGGTGYKPIVYGDGTRVGYMPVGPQLFVFYAANNDIANGVWKCTSIPTFIPSVYATCSTRASTNTKIVSISDEFTGFRLVSGITVNVQFTNANVATASLKLNVNDTGAKDIYYLGINYGSTTTRNTYLTWNTNSIVQFVYNGSYWVAVNNVYTRSTSVS